MSQETSNRYMVIEGVAGADGPGGETGVIAIESWEWGARAVAGDPGKGAEVYGLSITRVVDWASPRLLRLFETGTTVAVARLYEYSTVATEMKITVEIGLTNMIVVYHRRPSTGCGCSRETFGLQSAESVVRFLPQRSGRLN